MAKKENIEVAEVTEVAEVEEVKKTNFFHRSLKLANHTRTA